MAQQVSELMDGQLPPDVLAARVAAGCQAWQSDGQWRADWQAYHLIGDALRSEELALSATRDGAFMRSLRARLAAEPVVLAPAPLAGVAREPAVQPAPAATASPAASSRGARSHWLVAPVAVAAGFVAVASVVLVLRGRGETASEPMMAAAPISDWLSGTQTVLVPLEPPAQPFNATMVRDARLDAYLSAHRRVSNGISVAPPGAVIRSVDTLAPVDK